MLGGVKIDLERNCSTSWNVCTDYNFCQPMLSSCLVHIKIRMFTGRACRQFSTEERQFATTLHYYSPVAYQYLCRHFKLLPSPRTVRDWLSSFNGQPGYMEQSFKTIATKVYARTGKTASRYTEINVPQRFSFSWSKSEKVDISVCRKARHQYTV